MSLCVSNDQCDPVVCWADESKNDIEPNCTSKDWAKVDSDNDYPAEDKDSETFLKRTVNNHTHKIHRLCACGKSSVLFSVTSSRIHELSCHIGDSFDELGEDKVSNSNINGQKCYKCLS